NELQSELDYYTEENVFGDSEYTFNFPESEPVDINVSESFEPYKSVTNHEQDEELVNETLERESGKVCEGHTCWAKTVLNKLSGLNLPLNNKPDETTKNAIANFQLRNSITPTRNIDF